MKYASTLLLMALISLSCGDNGEEVPPPASLVELDELCAVLAKAECDRLSSCGLLQPPLDVVACTAREKDIRCGLREHEARRLIELAEVEFDREAAARCRDEISGVGCEIGHRPSVFLTTACRQLWRPRVAEGGACSSSFSCSEALACVISDMCPGTCKAQLSTNQPCEFGDVCDDANFCSITAMRCRARVARGQPCEGSLSGNPCRDGSWCDLGQLGGPECVAAGGRGFACESTFQCASSARCLAGRCSAGLEDDGCALDLDCQDGRVCAGGRCRTPTPLGEICSVSNAVCAEGSLCLGEENAMRCLALAGVGGTCSEASDCYASDCKGGQCVGPSADGQSCEIDLDCLPGRSCVSAVCTIVDTCFL